jgi:hypothetical protein
MRSRRIFGATSSVVLSAGLFLTAFAGSVAAQGNCQLTVDPQQATAGTTFMLHGSGFTPSQLILQREGGQAVTIDLDLKGQDPFSIPIGSRKGDEGAWHATASLPGTCSPSVVFNATLENTDAVSDAVATLTGSGSGPSGQGHLPLGIYILVIVVGFTGGAVVAWKLRLA